MIGEKIIHDLELLPVKDTDSVSEIDRTTDDYLYFQLNEVYFEDDNEKARQQTIITANAMDKTMHSLNKEISFSRHGQKFSIHQGKSHRERRLLSV